MADHVDATRILARILGPFHALVAVVAILHPPAGRTLLLSNVGIWPWPTGGVILMIGLGVLAVPLHRRDAAAAVVKLLGGAITAWGLVLLALPHWFTHFAWVTLGYPWLWNTFYVALAAVGLYLTWVGWGPDLLQLRRRLHKG